MNSKYDMYQGDDVNDLLKRFTQRFRLNGLKKENIPVPTYLGANFDINDMMDYKTAFSTRLDTKITYTLKIDEEELYKILKEIEYCKVFEHKYEKTMLTLRQIEYSTQEEKTAREKFPILNNLYNKYKSTLDLLRNSEK